MIELRLGVGRSRARPTRRIHTQNHSLAPCTHTHTRARALAHTPRAVLIGHSVRVVSFHKAVVMFNISLFACFISPTPPWGYEGPLIDIHLHFFANYVQTRLFYAQVNSIELSLIQRWLYEAKYRRLYVHV